MFNSALYGRGYKPLSPALRAKYQSESFARHGSRLGMLSQFQDVPPAFSCQDKGWDTPTWDQGSCGSCYLVSTVRSMTCAFIKAGYGKPDGSFALSAQYGMDCHDFGGCGGGNGTEVVDWAKSNGWYAEKYIDHVDGQLHTDYPPYQARSASCRLPSGSKKWAIADWGFITKDGSFNVAAMKTAMYNYGVLNVALDAGGQFGNGTDTITSLGSSINHEITAVAYDDSKDGGSVLLKNQWGNDWGTNGCRWCTYHACASIVDWFFVTAVPLAPITVSVPSVLGLSVESAKATIQTAGLVSVVQGVPTGVVLAQSPVPGTSVPTGSSVVLTVGAPVPPVPPAKILWSGTFVHDWPAHVPFSLPLAASAGSVLQLLASSRSEDPFL